MVNSSFFSRQFYWDFVILNSLHASVEQQSVYRCNSLVPEALKSEFVYCGVKTVLNRFWACAVATPDRLQSKTANPFPN